MAIALKQKSDVTVYPMGTYPARLKDVIVENKPADQYHSEPYQQLRWVWDLKLPGRKETVPYSTWTSCSLSPKSHLPGLLKALGVWVEGMTSMEEDACKGKICDLLVEEQLGTDGTLRNKTTKYIPKAQRTAPVQVPQAVAPVVPAPAADDDFPPLETEDDDSIPF